MNTPTTNRIIGLLRKSVGLPPAKGGCCGAPAPKEIEPKKKCCESAKEVRDEG